jgi:hypothetical protein
MGVYFEDLPRDPVSLLLEENPGLNAEEIVSAKVTELQWKLFEAGAIGTEPPFNPYAMARALDIPIRTMDDPKLTFEACLVPFPGGRHKILLNSTNRSARRRRFSIAHELVHTLFPEADSTFQYRLATQRDPHQELERLVDFGAAQLLMPPKLFAADVRRLGLSVTTLLHLSERYQVSLQAAALNMAGLAPTPCAFAFCSFAFRPSSRPEGQGQEKKKWRIDRAFTSRDFPRYLYPGQSWGPDSVVERSAQVGSTLCAVENLGPRLGMPSAAALRPIRSGTGSSSHRGWWSSWSP